MSSGFISEKEIAEARKKRQEEWEKVRTPDQPSECPEAPYDPRSLYDQLQEQKAKKDLEFEESHKYKNLIRGLNNDEVQFLETVDQNKLNMEKNQMLAEEQELKEFRNRVANLQEEVADKKISSELKARDKTMKMLTTASKPSQKSLLSVGIKRKNGKVPSTATATETHQEEPTSAESKQLKVEKPINNTEKSNVEQNPNDRKALTTFQYYLNTNTLDKGFCKCVAILPGLGSYPDSSDSEMSSDSDDEDPLYFTDDQIKYDLVGRQIMKKKPCAEE